MYQALNAVQRLVLWEIEVPAPVLHPSLYSCSFPCNLTIPFTKEYAVVPTCVDLFLGILLCSIDIVVYLNIKNTLS